MQNWSLVYWSEWGSLVRGTEHDIWSIAVSQSFVTRGVDMFGCPTTTSVQFCVPFKDVLCHISQWIVLPMQRYNERVLLSCLQSMTNVIGLQRASKLMSYAIILPLESRIHFQRLALQSTTNLIGFGFAGSGCEEWCFGSFLLLPVKFNFSFGKKEMVTRAS